MYNAEHIAFRDIAIRDNTGWFFNVGYNAIMSVNLLSGEVSLEAFAPDDSVGGFEYFASIEIYDEKLYLAPRSDKRICIYSIKTKTFEFVDLDLENYCDCDEHTYNLFNTVKEIDGNIYFFPGRFHALVKLDPKDNGLEYISDWYSEIEKTWEPEVSNIFIFNKVHIDNKKCTMACWRTNSILEIDLPDGNWQLRQTKGDLVLSDVVKKENSYIYATKNPTSLLTTEGEYLLDDNAEGGYFIFEGKNNYCVIPIFGNSFSFIDKKTLEEIKKVIFENETEEEQSWINYKNLALCNRLMPDGRLLSYITRNNEIQITNIETFDIDRKKLFLNGNSKYKAQKYFDHLLMKEILYENANLNVSRFISAVGSL